MPIVPPKVLPEYGFLTPKPERLQSAEIYVTEAARKCKQSKIRKRGVRFSCDMYVRPCLHIDNYTDEEIENSWYNTEEIRCIKIEMILTVIARKKGRQLDSDQTFRGLECRTKEGSNLRSLNKVTGVEAVFDEQDNQYSIGVCDEELIQEAYRKKSAKCQIYARIMGKKDEQEANMER